MTKASAGSSKPRTHKFLRRAGLYGVPLLAAGLGAYFYVTGGRYVGTDNAYLKGHVVSISSDISGRVTNVLVHENERVKTGDVLYTLDRVPVQIALDQATADYQAAVNDIVAKEATYRQRQADLASQQAKRALAEREFERRKKLVDDRVISISEFDQHKSDVDVAKRDEAAIAEDMRRIAAELNGDPGLDPAKAPAVMAAAAKIDEVKLDLARTEIHAPADGIVSKVDALRPGDWSTAGAPVFTIYADRDMWVEANLKETDLTNVKVGQPATISIDAYPGMRINAHVESIGAATGSEFSVIRPKMPPAIG